MVRGRTLSLLVLLATALACSSTDDSTSSGNQSGPCKVDADCTAKLAQCVTDGSAQACTGPLDDHPFERDCAGATTAAAAVCPGLVCLSLKPNKQNKAGICSTFCADDTDCPEGRCIAAAGHMVCLHKCTGDEGCANGFVCAADGLCAVTVL